MALLVMAMLAVPLGLSIGRRERDRLITAVERDSRVLAAEADDDFESGDFTRLPALVDRYVRETGGRVVMVDANGIAVIDSDAPSAVPRDFSTRPEFVQALAGHYNTGERASNTLGESLLYVAVPIVQEGKVIGAVRVSYPTTTLDHRVRSVWIKLVSLSGVVLVVVAAGAWVVARTLSRPIRQLEAAAGELGGGDLSARVAIEYGPRDLVDVAVTFNTMAERLQALVESQRSFLADASHQLRTPLTALRLRLDSLAAGRVDLDDGEVDSDTSAALAEVDRLSELVDALLTMARVEARVGDVLTAVDVLEVVRERLAVWTPLADERGVSLVLNQHGAAPAAGVVEGGLQQILDNLIANAVEVAPPSSEIVVGVRSGGDTVTVSVSDEGPGLSDAQIERAFDRFWRGPGSSDGGSGLGLAIVARLAESSGGSARIERRGRGLTVTVTLPTAHGRS